MPQKMLPPNVSVYWAAGYDAIADINAPTVAELTAAWTPPDFTADPAVQGSGVLNVSCAVVDPFTLGWTDRDTDDSASICDDSNVETPTRKNYEAQIQFFREGDSADTASVYMQSYEAFKKPMQPGYLIKRVGKRAGEPIVAGDEVQVFQVLSGDPNSINDNEGPVQSDIRFYAQGVSSDGWVEVVPSP